MRVHIIDTSILVNILDIPYRNQDRKCVIEEFNKLKDNDAELLLLPLATIIETGNHISHIGDGNLKRDRAIKMAELLQDTVNDIAPWQYIEKEFDRADLMKIAKEFPENIFIQKSKDEKCLGIGDLSIIRTYEKYKDSTPGIERIRIWSLDSHLSTFCEEFGIRKKRK